MSTKETVLITGCSDGGIGSALALIFQKKGYHVFATARDTSKMSDLKDLSNVTMLTLDNVKPDTIEAAVESVTKATGGTLNYLINNAAHNHFRPMLDENIEEARTLFETNVWGPLAITQTFSPLVIKAKGSLVFITSISGYVNCPWMGTYAASKRSIEIIADALRLEVKPFGVNVLSIVTGAVKSKGQTYFEDYKLPENSLYKDIEDVIIGRAQGTNDGMARMPTLEYAEPVVEQIIKRTEGKFWYGVQAEETRASLAPPVSHEVLDPFFIQNTGLDTWGQK